MIYPGLGFGAVLARTKEVTDTMIVAGAQRLAELSPAIKTQNETSSEKNKTSGSHSRDGDYAGEALLPDFGDSPRVNFEIGIAVAEQCIREGKSGLEGEILRVEDVRKRAGEKVWVPLYPDYVYDPKGQQ